MYAKMLEIHYPALLPNKAAYIHQLFIMNKIRSLYVHAKVNRQLTDLPLLVGYTEIASLPANEHRKINYGIFDNTLQF